MSRLRNPSIGLFQHMAAGYYLIILKQIDEIIETRPDLKGVSCNSIDVAKKALLGSFSRGYYKRGNLRFVRDTVDLAENVLDTISDYNRRAEIWFFLENCSLSI